MFKKLLLPVIFVVLGYGFWVSPEFKEIAAGVAIFLFGMISLEEGFKAFTGGVLEKFLKKSTNKLWKSLTFGLVSTTLMQSSSLVTVITISFITAGLIGLAQGIGIIFGANLGTTTGAWIIAGFGFKVDIASYSMPMLAFGMILVFQKSNPLKGVGYVLAGLGFLFLGIHYMKSGFESIGETINLAEFAVTGFKGLLIYTLIGMFATVVMQSSHATLTLTIAALATSQITYENALALAIGSNVGTTITAILGALSANMAGRRLAGAHLIFNLITGIIAIIFIHQLVQVVAAITSFMGIAEDDYTLKLATFHTIFNLIGVVVMIPFINVLVKLLEKLFVEKEEVAGISQPLFVKDAALHLPDTSLEAIVKENIHLGHNVFSILIQAMNLRRDDLLTTRKIEEIVKQSSNDLKADVGDLYERRVKPIYSAIVTFIGKAMGQDLTPEQGEKLTQEGVAAHSLVDAVKVMKEIQPNMTRYISSDNKYMRYEYNQMRIHFAEGFRALRHILDEDISDFEMIKNIINAQKLEIEKDDILANGRLDKYIRENLIDSSMASSLLNDSSYAYDLMKQLTKAVEIIFGELISLRMQLSLVEPELEDALRRSEQDIKREIRQAAEELDQLKSSNNMRIKD